jgi:hypothetical protein
MSSLVALFGGCCCLMLVLLIAGVVYFLFGRKQNSPLLNNVVDPAYAQIGGIPGAPAGGAWGGVVSRVTSDGFWMLGQALMPGSIVNYRYRSGNDWITRSVPYQPGPDGHFVYLGHPPGNIQITHVTPPNANVSAPPPNESEPLPTMIIDTPFAKPTGFPPAY